MSDNLTKVVMFIIAAIIIALLVIFDEPDGAARACSGISNPELRIECIRIFNETMCNNENP